MDQPIRRRRARRASRPELDRTARRYYIYRIDGVTKNTGRLAAIEGVYA